MVGDWHPAAGHPPTPIPSRAVAPDGPSRCARRAVPELVSLPSGELPPHQTCTRSRIDPRGPRCCSALASSLFSSQLLAPLGQTRFGAEPLARHLVGINGQAASSHPAPTDTTEEQKPMGNVSTRTAGFIHTRLHGPVSCRAYGIGPAAVRLGNVTIVMSDRKSALSVATAAMFFEEVAPKLGHTYQKRFGRNDPGRMTSPRWWRSTDTKRSETTT